MIENILTIILYILSVLLTFIVTQYIKLPIILENMLKGFEFSMFSLLIYLFNFYHVNKKEKTDMTVGRFSYFVFSFLFIIGAIIYFYTTIKYFMGGFN